MTNVITKQKLSVHIRWMIRRDMPEVLDIEQKSFEFPWLDDDFIRCLRQRNCIGMVAEPIIAGVVEEKIVGFMVYELHKTHLHIVNLAVSPDFRYQGIGCQMTEKLIGKLSNERRNQITLEVRESNLPAQLFFQHMGFWATKVVKSPFETSTEDAYEMEYNH